MLLLDNSAWARLGLGGLRHARRDEVATWMERGLLATTLPFLLEAGYSARSGPDHQRLLTSLRALPRIEITPEIEALTIEAQAALAAVGHHRLAPSDVVIAACAHAAGAGVLHYDHDYDVLRERTALTFDSVWLAPAGSL